MVGQSDHGVEVRPHGLPGCLQILEDPTGLAPKVFLADAGAGCVERTTFPSAKIAVTPVTSATIE
jgi:hypothetical protein